MESINIIKEINSKVIRIEDLERFIGKTVQIIINPLKENTTDTPSYSLKGSLKKYADLNLIKEEKKAWVKAVRDKYDS